MLCAGLFLMKQPLAAPSLDRLAAPVRQNPRIDEWMSLCQRPDIGRMEKWLADNLADELVEQAPVDEVAQEEAEFCKSHGGFRIVQKAGTREDMSLVAMGTKSGVWFDFSLAENAGGKIAGLHHRVTSPPEAQLPPLRSDAEIAAEVRRKVARLSRSDLFSGIVSVARDKHIIVKASGGYADRVGKAPITGTTRFTVGSLSKMFTAVAIGQLVDQGKVKFDDPVGKFFPDYPNQIVREQVTVGMLLSHTAGMGDFLANRTPEMMKNGVKRAVEFMPLYDKDSLQFEPGKGWAYSNAGFALAGAIVEQASGEDFADYLRKHVFAVAGMARSDPNNVPVSANSLVTPYTKVTAQGPSPDWHAAENDIGSPAGGAVSTADDLVRFADALREGKLVSQATLAEITKTHGTTPWGAHYGYAMEIADTYGLTVVGHGGGFAGVSSHLYILLDSKYTVVTLANQDPPAADYAGVNIAAIVAKRAKLESAAVRRTAQREKNRLANLKPKRDICRSARKPEVEAKEARGIASRAECHQS